MSTFAVTQLSPQSGPGDVDPVPRRGDRWRVTLDRQKSSRDAPDFHLHLGSPKTATTWLQRHWFPRLGGFRYLEKPRLDAFAAGGFGSIEGYRYGIFDRCFAGSPEIWRVWGQRILGGLCDASRPVLVSDEGAGTAGKRPELLAAHLRGLRRAVRRAGFRELKVLCVIRRQDQWLGSHYAQMSDRIPNASQRDFERFVDEWLDPCGDYYSKGLLLDYAAQHRAMSWAVGAGHLMMMPFEALRAEPEAYLSSLRTFLGDPPLRPAPDDDAEACNVRSIHGDRWELRRPRPAFRLGGRFGLRLPEPGRGRHVALDDDLRRKILAAYGGSNRRTAQLTGWDLGRFGYSAAPGLPRTEEELHLSP